ncbi:glycosyltransferase family protein 64 C3-like [Phragmites australis]|uniref:glycosyltransferase family protein 64 C3-like n=1 Tax=Phragmites australis TaxID=29695 RepID=UPI002D7A3303|nr:glycosyltransferase family protein 64 C3-like [Phragmites australis]
MDCHHMQVLQSVDFHSSTPSRVRTLRTHWSSLWSCSGATPPPSTASSFATGSRTTSCAASASLNSCFLPDPSIRTVTITVVDNNVLPDTTTLSFTYAAWQAAYSGSLVGFFSRSHHLDLTHGRWAYTTT